MGLFDALLGKSKQVKANLDGLFAVPTAAITLAVAANLDATNRAAVVFMPASGAAFANTEKEFQEVIAEFQNTSVEFKTDSFGYRWVIITADGIESLVTAVHSVNRSLEDHGFSPQLLCSVFGFTGRTTGARAYWVYLYKRGTFYPFVPAGHERRDNEQELSLKATVGTDLPLEEDTSRWFALWDIPF